ncbi:MAG: hypothetical protein R2867_02840 [Caldilineaceae bacterium]
MDERLYAYAFSSYDGYSRPVWRKSAAWMDQVITSLMLEKLSQTFDGDSWDQTVEQLDAGVEEERRVKGAASAA